MAISGIGDIVYGREKVVKIKPKKVVEESAFQFDPVAVAMILAGIFLLAVGMFGESLIALATFSGLSLLILK